MGKMSPHRDRSTTACTCQWERESQNIPVSPAHQAPANKTKNTLRGIFYQRIHRGNRSHSLLAPANNKRNVLSRSPPPAFSRVVVSRRMKRSRVEDRRRLGQAGHAVLSSHRRRCGDNASQPSAKQQQKPLESCLSIPPVC